MTFAVIAVLALAGIICWMFLAGRRSDAQPPSSPSEESDLDAILDVISAPAILAKASQEETRSYFGGHPPTLEGFAWPTRSGRELSFLACVECSELPCVPELDWLPQEGVLLFFCGLDDRSWGCEPQDRDGWRVFHVPSSAPAGERRASSATVLPKKFLRFSSGRLPPNRVTGETAEHGLTEDPDGMLMDYRSNIFNAEPEHQIGGFPGSIHETDLQLDCQMASNGLYTNIASGYDDPRADELAAGVPEWSLLFQMAFADDEDFDAASIGSLYFLIRREDAKAGRFDKTWLINQFG